MIDATPRGRWTRTVATTRLALAFVLIVALGWQAIVIGLASAIVATNDFAAAHRLGRPLAILGPTIASDFARRGDWRAAAIAARATLPDRPVDAKALGVLGVSQEQLGDDDASARTMAVAGRLGWREPFIQLWLLKQALLADDTVAAMLHADALARVQFGDEATSRFFQTAIAVPAGRAAMADRLEARPAWRVNLFVATQHYPAALNPAIEALFVELAKRGSAPSRAEIWPLVDKLITEHEYARARAVWRRWARPVGGAALVNDGDFSQARRLADDSAHFAFDWQIGDANQSAATIADAGATPPALHSETSGGNGDRLARQMLLLAPGAYQLAVEVSGEQGPGRNAFAWTITCLPGNAPIELQPISDGGARWRADFVVPDNGCPAQDLALETRGVGGQVATIDYDNLAIVARAGNAQ